MIKQRLTEYLEATLLFQFDDEITEYTDLFKAGIVDSYGYIQLIKFIEDAFEIRLSKSELLSNVITTLSGLVTLVETKFAQSGRSVGEMENRLPHDAADVCAE